MVVFYLGRDLLVSAQLPSCTSAPIRFAPVSATTTGSSFLSPFTVLNGVNIVQICVNDQVSYGEGAVDEIVRINIANNLDDFVYANFYAGTPEIDCFTIDATAGKIGQLEAHVSDEDFGGGTVLQRIRGLKVYSDRANPVVSQGYGTFPVGATVHTYSFATDKYFVGLAVV